MLTKSSMYGNIYIELFLRGVFMDRNIFDLTERNMFRNRPKKFNALQKITSKNILQQLIQGSVKEYHDEVERIHAHIHSCGFVTGNKKDRIYGLKSLKLRHDYNTCCDRCGKKLRYQYQKHYHLCDECHQQLFFTDNTAKERMFAHLFW